jgi:hypothetical protein
MKPQSKTEAIVCWVLAVVLPVAGFLGLFFGLGDRTIQWWINSLCIPAVVILLVCAQLWIHRTGVFDVLFFGFYRLFESWRTPDVKKYDLASDYHVAMDEKRQKNKPYYLPFIVISGLFLIVTIFLLFVENRQAA